MRLSMILNDSHGVFNIMHFFDNNYWEQGIFEMAFTHI